MSENNLIIRGAGTGSGGVYNKVKISGAGEINGDIECVELKISGAGEITGNIKMETASVSGAAEINGNIEGGSLSVSGGTEVSGDINCKSITLSGAVEVKGEINGGDFEASGASEIYGSISCERIKLSGVTVVSGDCNAEVFNSTGIVEVHGLVNAEKVFIYMKGTTEIKEIGGQEISVKRDDKKIGLLQSMLNLDWNKQLNTNLIEGDKIYLEYTCAKIVRGHSIEIGEGCNIDTIEYSGELITSGNSKINKKIKI